MNRLTPTLSLFYPRRVASCLLTATLTVSLVTGCSGGSPAAPASPDAGADVSTQPDDSGGAGDAATDGATPPVDGGASVAVSFAYTPQWDGVSKVEVVGGFGQSTDWSRTASLLTLAKSGAAYAGTAMLPPGAYLYVLRVTGDALAATPATYVRYALDPLQTAFDKCPMASPTYSKIDVNPCSQLTVTASGGGAPAAPVHVKGSVALGGAAATGWMVWIEREEPKSHHFFANRLTVGQDGSFDLVASAGRYRLQVQYPTLLSATDLSRDATSLGALRRSISDPFVLAATDVTVPTPDVAFSDYGSFAPSGDGGALPTQFSFQTGEARLDIYGGPGDGGVVNIGDPWFASATTTDGGAVFGGAFNTAQAGQDAAAPGTRYMWGTEQPFGADASVAWTNQSMVLPISWR